METPCFEKNKVTAGKAEGLRSCIPVHLNEKDRSIIVFQHGEEGALGEFHLTDHLHALFTLLLLVEEFSLSGNIAAVTFGRDVLAEGTDGFP
jgi:hypothetical protein